jgi:hypothetical protein
MYLSGIEIVPRLEIIWNASYRCDPSVMIHAAQHVQGLMFDPKGDLRCGHLPG